jgi:CRP-like cAMP-binding protein
METGALGRLYQDSDVIYRQGEPGNCMYVILEGKVEIYLDRDGQEVPLRLCREGEFLEETAIFDKEERSANARSLGTSRLLTVDKKNFLRRIQEDPTIAFRLVQELTRRVRGLDEDVAVLSRALRECLNEKLR